MIDLEAYLQKKPEFTEEQLQLLGFIQNKDCPIKSESQYLYYVWMSKIKVPDTELPGPENAYIELFVGQNPIIYEVNWITEKDATRAVLEARDQGYEIPKDFIDRLMQTKKVRADSETALINRENPLTLPTAFYFWEPVWSILNMAEGLPVYDVRMRAPVWGPHYDPTIRPTMRSALTQFTERFDGIGYDPELGKIISSLKPKS